MRRWASGPGTRACRSRRISNFREPFSRACIQSPGEIGDRPVTAIHRTATQPVPDAGAPEAELVRRAQARDEAALRAIMQANNRRLYRLARGILRNDSEAEDVVQETY